MTIKYASVNMTVNTPLSWVQIDTVSPKPPWQRFMDLNVDMIKWIVGNPIVKWGVGSAIWDWLQAFLPSLSRRRQPAEARASLTHAILLSRNGPGGFSIKSRTYRARFFPL